MQILFSIWKSNDKFPEECTWWNSSRWTQLKTYYKTTGREFSGNSCTVESYIECFFTFFTLWSFVNFPEPLDQKCVGEVDDLTFSWNPYNLECILQARLSVVIFEIKKEYKGPSKIWLCVTPSLKNILTDIPLLVKFHVITVDSKILFIQLPQPFMTYFPIYLILINSSTTLMHC